MIKAALTKEQARHRRLSKDFEAKLTSSRAARFIKAHGHNVWELEALSPAALQKIVRDSIISTLDLEQLNAEQCAEAEDAQRLHGIRESVRVALWQIAGEVQS